MENVKRKEGKTDKSSDISGQPASTGKAGGDGENKFSGTLHKPYKCEKCGKAFKLRSSYLIHMNKHKGTKYICKVCGKSYTANYSLMLHQKSHASDPAERRPHKCSTCDKRFVTKYQCKMHETTHKDGSKQNDNKSSLGCKDSLNEHLGVHENLKPWACDKCEAKFLRKFNLCRHQKIHLKSQPENENGSKQNDKPSLGCKDSLNEHLRGHENLKPWACDKCEAKFLRKFNLSRHPKIHLRSQPENESRDKDESKQNDNHSSLGCKICGKFFSRLSALRLHIEKHMGKKYTCSKCDKSFTARDSLNKHLSWHKNLKPWACDKCEAKFLRKHHLHRHQKIHLKNNAKPTQVDDWDSLPPLKPPGAENRPTKTKQYLCKICNNIYSRKSSLRAHFNNKHRGKRYECPSCDKSFSAKDTLKKHLLWHENVKPWICGTCGAQFRQRYHMIRHERAHLPREKQKMCETCGKKYYTTESLNQHRRVHDDIEAYQCKTCGKGFKYSSSLMLHARIHQKERDFKCNICTRGFNQKKTLENHMELHRSQSVSRKKGFLVPPVVYCDLCGLGLSSKRGLQKHLKKHREGTLMKFNRKNNRDFTVVKPIINQDYENKTVEVKGDMVSGKLKADIHYEVISNEIENDVNDESLELKHYSKKVSSFINCAWQDFVVKKTDEKVAKASDSLPDVVVKSINETNNKAVNIDISDIAASKVAVNNDIAAGQVTVNKDISDITASEISVDKDISDIAASMVAVNKDIAGGQVDVNKDNSDIAACKVSVNKDISDIAASKAGVREMSVEEPECFTQDKVKNSTSCKYKEAESKGMDHVVHHIHQNIVKKMKKSLKEKPVDGNTKIKPTEQIKVGKYCQLNETRETIGSIKVSRKLLIDNNVEVKDEYARLEDNIAGMGKECPVADDDINTHMHEQNCESDNVSESGELFIHSDYDSEATEIIENFNESESNEWFSVCETGYSLVENTSATSVPDYVVCLHEQQDKTADVFHDFEDLSIKDDDKVVTSCIEESEKEIKDEISDDVICMKNIYNRTLANSSEQTKHTKKTKLANTGDNSFNISKDGTNESISHPFQSRYQMDNTHMPSFETEQSTHGQGTVGTLYDINNHCNVIEHCQINLKSFGEASSDSVKVESSLSEPVVNIVAYSEKNPSFVEKRSDTDRDIDCENDDTDAFDFKNDLEGRKNICEVCKKVFKLHVYLRKHMRLFHPDNDIVYKCFKGKCCETFTSQGEYRQHLLSHNEIICQLCGKKCKGTNELIVHVQSKHDTIGKAIDEGVACMICKKVFEDEMDAAEHFKSHLVVRNSANDSNEEPYKCDHCSKTFLKKQSLIRHTAIHYSEEKSTCEKCGKVFTQGVHLQRHLLSNACSSDFECFHCEHKFHTAGQLRVHLKAKHDEQAYECPLCHKRFATSSSMHRHKRFHVDETSDVKEIKPYMCSICGKCYTAAHSLKVHVVTHSGTRPFQCDICGQSYKQRAHLLRHVATLHKGIKKFKCESPGCEKAFPDKRALITHMRVHTGEKPYICTECNKSFTQPQILKVHMKTHLAAKEHECLYCKQQFSTKMSLLRHVKRHKCNEYQPATETNEASAKKKQNVVTKMPDKLFQCERCERNFTTRRATLLHIRRYCSGKKVQPEELGVEKTNVPRDEAVPEVVVENVGDCAPAFVSQNAIVSISLSGVASSSQCLVECTSIVDETLTVGKTGIRENTDICSTSVGGSSTGQLGNVPYTSIVQVSDRAVGIPTSSTAEVDTNCHAAAVTEQTITNTEVITPIVNLTQMANLQYLGVVHQFSGYYQ